MVDPVSNGQTPPLWRLILAKDFRENETGERFVYQHNTIEKLGNSLRWGVGSLADLLFREIKNPVMIVALTALAMLTASIAIYPAATLSMVSSVFPFVLAIKPWMIKLAVYISMQSTVLGVGLRTYGHLANPELRERWDRGELEAVFIGDRRRN